jgi:uncharacterized protein (TIGR02611 family)
MMALATVLKPSGEARKPVIQTLFDQSLRHARRLVIAVVGMTVLLLGIALLVLPGPAFIVIPLGLAILAVEFAWARRLLKRVRRGISDTLRNGRMRRNDTQ